MTPPKYFQTEERAIWREIVKATPVTITDADRPALEVLVTILTKQRNRVKLSTSERTALLKLLIEFRCTPGSRKSESSEPNATNKFAELG